MNVKSENSMNRPSNYIYIYIHNVAFLIRVFSPFFLRDGFSQENINLTHMYYAKKFFSYMKQRYLKNQWRQFLALPAKQQVLEQAGVMMIQWCKLKARVSTACTKTALDKIALDVMKLLRECNPKHSILSISDEQLRFWKSNNIDDNHWNRVETVQLLDTINKVVHNEFKFHIHCGSSLLWPELSFDYVSYKLLP